MPPNAQALDRLKATAEKKVAPSARRNVRQCPLRHSNAKLSTAGCGKLARLTKVHAYVGDSAATACPIDSPLGVTPNAAGGRRSCQARPSQRAIISPGWSHWNRHACPAAHPPAGPVAVTDCTPAEVHWPKYCTARQPGVRAAAILVALAAGQPTPMTRTAPITATAAQADLLIVPPQVLTLARADAAGRSPSCT